MDGLNIVQCDITKIKVDIIVNAANKTLLGGGGVDGAIHKAAGPQLLEECKLLHGCKTGKAKITKAYNLPAQYIIHTVGPIYRFYNSSQAAKLLSDCYRNSLNLAKDYGLHHIAFPSISTGVYGYPAREATQVAFKVVKNWLKDNYSYKMQITMCAFDKKMYKIFDEIYYE